MLTDDIRKYLFEQQDIKYRDFQMKLIPTVDPDTALGVRPPVLRKYARQLVKEPDISEFLNDILLYIVGFYFCFIVWLLCAKNSAMDF